VSRRPRVFLPLSFYSAGARKHITRRIVWVSTQIVFGCVLPPLRQAPEVVHQVSSGREAEGGILSPKGDTLFAMREIAFRKGCVFNRKLLLNLAS